MQASDLIWRSCEHLTSDENELSLCIGQRREISRDALSASGVIHCAVDFDQDSSGENLAEALSAEKKKVMAGRLDRACRLILYSELIKLKGGKGQDRYRNGADARLDWLSSLAVNPSHPLERHPNQQ